jgi:Domain of unknown function (DUF6898)
MPSSKSGQGSRSGAPPKGAGAGAGSRTVYFEFIPAGASVRVTAIDSQTGTEATIVGPARAGRASLERTALAKLRYVMNRTK